MTRVRVLAFFLLVLPFLAHAQDVPPPAQEDAVAAPAADPVAQGLTPLLSRWISDPVVMSLVIAAIVGFVAAVRKIIAALLRAKARAVEEEAKATPDTKDDISAKVKHDTLEQVADAIEGKK
jgi:hypothetical protein